ncbi:MAG: thioredoxin family protein [Deltaproteobacteria bacterium]
MRRSRLVALAAAFAACNPPGPTSRAPLRETPPVAREGTPPTPVVRGVRFERAAPEGDVATQVASALGRAAAQHRRLVVYVGAAWCEPCQYFHRAAEAHALDDAFPDLTLLEFDMDHDAARLQVAGYASRMIPLFCVPGTDGRATDARMEGSVHGPASVDEIKPRLRAVLGG